MKYTDLVRSLKQSSQKIRDEQERSCQLRRSYKAQLSTELDKEPCQQFLHMKHLGFAIDDDHLQRLRKHATAIASYTRKTPFLLVLKEKRPLYHHTLEGLDECHLFQFGFLENSKFTLHMRGNPNLFEEWLFAPSEQRKKPRSMITTRQYREIEAKLLEAKWPGKKTPKVSDSNLPAQFELHITQEFHYARSPFDHTTWAKIPGSMLFMDHYSNLGRWDIVIGEDALSTTLLLNGPDERFISKIIDEHSSKQEG